MGQNFARNWLVPLSGCYSGTYVQYVHSPALNNDKDPYELSVTTEPSVPPPALNRVNSIFENSIIHRKHFFFHRLSQGVWNKERKEYFDFWMSFTHNKFVENCRSPFVAQKKEFLHLQCSWHSQRPVSVQGFNEKKISFEN